RLEKSKNQPQRSHYPRALAAKRRERAQRHNRADNRRAEHVSHRAGNRQTFADEAPDDHHAAAFAHRHHRAEQAAERDGGVLIFRQKFRQRRGRDKRVNQAGQNRAEQQKRNAFEQNAQKRKREIREVKRKPTAAVHWVSL